VVRFVDSLVITETGPRSRLAGDWSLPAPISIRPHCPANHPTTPPATSLDARDFDNNGHAIWKTPRNALQPIDPPFPLSDYPLPEKTAPRSFQLQSLYRHESPLSLTLRNGLQRSSNALHRAQPPSAKQRRRRIHEYEPKRGNMLEFNNFRMVNVVELVSMSQKSQGLKGFKVSSSLFKFTLIVYFDVRG